MQNINKLNIVMSESIDTSSIHDILVEQAKLAEQAERYDDMSDYMKECVQFGKPLNVEVS